MPMEIIRQKWYPRNWNIRKWGNSRKWCGVSKTQVLLSIHPVACMSMWTHPIKEDILFKALNVQTRREDEYCQKVRPMVLEKIRRMPNSTITMEKFKRAWYEGNDGSSEHYNWTRYYALNLHAVFSKGTLEWRCFESTLHAGKVRSNITLALAISAQAINQSCTHAKKTEIGDNPAFTFRTFLLRLGLIGDEYKNVRKHLLANLDGDKAWRYDKSTYACLQNPRRTDDAR